MKNFATLKNENTSKRQSMEKNNITKEDVLNFFRQHSRKCSKCPFKNVCDNTYSLTRGHSTSAITICNALNMDDKSFEVYSAW